MHAQPCALPWWHILEAPALRTAPGPIYRATVALALAYWAGGCQPLATDDVTLAALARLAPARWRECKPGTLAALAQITPHLDAAHAECVRRQQRDAEKGQALTAARIARRAERERRRAPAQVAGGVLAQPRRDPPPRPAPALPPPAVLSPAARPSPWGSSRAPAQTGTTATFTD